MLVCPKPVVYYFNTDNPKYKGLVGATGATGATGAKGPDGVAKNLGDLTYEPYDGALQLRSTEHERFFRLRVRDILDEDEYGDEVETGNYLLIFRGDVRLVTTDAYVECKLGYDTSDLDTKTLGQTGFASIEGSPPFGANFHIQAQGYTAVTDLDHYIYVTFALLSEASKTKSYAEVFRGSLSMIKFDT